MILYKVTLDFNVHVYNIYIYIYRGGADPKYLGISMVYGRAAGTTT